MINDYNVVYGFIKFLIITAPLVCSGIVTIALFKFKYTRKLIDKYFELNT